MNSLQQLLKGDFVCRACGRTHRVTLRDCVVAADAFERLTEVVAKHAAGRRLTLVADTRTWRVAGNTAAEAVRQAGYTVGHIILPDAGQGRWPVCDDVTHRWLLASAPVTDLFLAVGSGVVNDLTKWTAYERETPYVVLATAASMNGYASDNVAPTIRGLKCLFPAAGPVAIVTSPALLQSAPTMLTTAGLGDVIAKPVSAADWRLNQLLFGDYFCAHCVELVREVEPLYMARPEALAEKNRAALEGLFEALVLSGLAMSMAGTSSPASGGEHLISHTLDMMATLDGTPHDLHGRQVGVGTILAAALYEQVLNLDTQLFPGATLGFEGAFWGFLQPEIEKQFARKQARLQQALQALRRRRQLWETVCQELKPMLRTPEEVKECLRRAGAADTLQDIGVSRERFLQALLHARDIRDRFTILDLAWITGVLPARAEALVDRWLC